MKCPVCGEEMTPYKTEPCHDSRNGKQYQRLKYRCERDDTWGRLEIPVESLNKLQQQAPAIC